jgi:hypothetical protein
MSQKPKLSEAVKELRELIRLSSETTWRIAAILAGLRKAEPLLYRELTLLMNPDKRDLLTRVFNDCGKVKDPRLTFVHHEEVYGLPDKDKRRWLSEAHKRRLTPAELRKEIREQAATIPDAKPARVRVNPALAYAVRMQREIRQGRLSREEAATQLQEVLNK